MLLPPEIWREILCKITKRVVQARAAQVCKLWRALINITPPTFKDIEKFIRKNEPWRVRYIFEHYLSHIENDFLPVIYMCDAKNKSPEFFSLIPDYLSLFFDKPSRWFNIYRIIYEILFNSDNVEAIIKLLPRMSQHGDIVFAAIDNKRPKCTLAILKYEDVRISYRNMNRLRSNKLKDELGQFTKIDRRAILREIKTIKYEHSDKQYEFVYTKKPAEKNAADKK